MTMAKTFDRRRALRIPALLVALVGVGCGGDAPADDERALAALFASESGDYCALPPVSAEVVQTRPGPGEPPVDDVNWFARPVHHDGTSRIVAFASHDQNHLYDLTRGVRVRIPDRSDAVATPDGRFMTVPSSYTPDSNVRFYPMQPLLDGLAAGRDADDTEPAFIHEHPSMKGVYYQSTGLVSEETADGRTRVRYRLMFSGGHDERSFRAVDYDFEIDAASADVLEARASAPMALCPEVRNDLNTPFISKDGRYIAAYTSESEDRGFTPGASLKLLEIDGVDPEAGTMSCTEVVDFGFAAGKADFAFDGSMLAFHISHGAYLTPFINGGLPSSTITDVVVARLDRDGSGAIVGAGPLRRLTTSSTAGVGSYFPAFFSDGSLFWIANAVPRDSEAPKRFSFHVAELGGDGWRANAFADALTAAGWATIESFWEASCTPQEPGLADEPFPLDGHEAPWIALSLGAGQCDALVRDARANGLGSEETDWDALGGLCTTLSP